MTESGLILSGNIDTKIKELGDIVVEGRVEQDLFKRTPSENDTPQLIDQFKARQRKLHASAGAGMIEICTGIMQRLTDSANDGLNSLQKSATLTMDIREHGQLLGTVETILTGQSTREENQTKLEAFQSLQLAQEFISRKQGMDFYRIQNYLRDRLRNPEPIDAVLAEQMLEMNRTVTKLSVYADEDFSQNALMLREADIEEKILTRNTGRTDDKRLNEIRTQLGVLRAQDAIEKAGIPAIKPAPAQEDKKTVPVPQPPERDHDKWEYNPNNRSEKILASLGDEMKAAFMEYEKTKHKPLDSIHAVAQLPQLTGKRQLT